MTITARDNLRAAIREEELAKAIRRSEAMYLTQTCRQAMALTGAEDAGYVRDLHGQCRGEIPGGVGCLCRCHDVIGEGIESGSIPVF